ncbi:MAG: hypothetical protein OEL78_02875 [Hyphomicrobiales bacterium]|nr:hypothetical protein [Hyphomicrobiales bacterium]
MTAKQTIAAPAATIDPENPAARQKRGSHKADLRHDPADNPAVNLGTESARDSAEYIAVLASQLQRIAETNGHGFLAYLIDMAILEAWRIAGPDADHPDTNANGVGGSRI